MVGGARSVPTGQASARPRTIGLPQEDRAERRRGATRWGSDRCSAAPMRASTRPRWARGSEEQGGAACRQRRRPRRNQRRGSLRIAVFVTVARPTVRRGRKRRLARSPRHRNRRHPNPPPAIRVRTVRPGSNVAGTGRPASNADNPITPGSPNLSEKAPDSRSPPTSGSRWTGGTSPAASRRIPNASPRVATHSLPPRARRFHRRSTRRRSSGRWWAWPSPRSPTRPASTSPRGTDG